jgi:hypothetical protein
MVTTPSATKVVTGKVRLSYCHVFEAYANQEGQDPKFSTVILIPKTDKATIAKLKAAQLAALEQGKDSKFGGKIPANWGNTLHDGDEEADLDRNPEYAGHLYMTVSSKTRPGIVDQDVNPIIESDQVYSGCYARVSINAFPYSASGNKGVSFGLNHIQKIADGDFLGGRSKAEDDFDAVEDETAGLI